MYDFEQEDQIDEFEALYMKIFDKETVDAETRSQLTLLKHLAELWIDEYFELKEMEHRLEKEPKGFPLSKDGHPCCICGRHLKAEDSWFDKNGIKCLTCQKAVRTRVVPVSVCKNRKSWFSARDLTREFGVDNRTIQKVVKSGDLKPRNILSEDGSLWFQLFMERENRSMWYQSVIDHIDKQSVETEQGH